MIFIKNSIFLLLLFLSTGLRAQHDYLLDSTLNLTFIPPFDNTIDFIKYTYDSDCRIVKAETEIYTIITEYGIGTKNVEKYSKETNIQTQKTEYFYNQYDLIKIRKGFEYEELTHIDSFFYDNNQSLIKANTYRFEDNEPYLYYDQKLVYNVEGLLIKDTTYYFNPQNGLERAVFRNQLYDENNHKILDIRYTDNQSQVRIDTTWTIYENSKIISQEYAQWQSNFYFGQLSAYEYFADKEIKYTSNRFNSSEDFELSSRIDSYYSNDLFYDLDTINHYIYLPDGNLFLTNQRSYLTIFNTNTDTAFVRIAGFNFSEDGNILFTTVNKLLYVKKSSTTNTKESFLIDIEIHPNPILSNDLINIRSKNYFDEILILNQLGQVLSSTKTQVRKMTYLPFEFPKGTYFVILKYKNKQISIPYQLIVN